MGFFELEYEEGNKKEYGCTACGLYEQATSPKMKPSGEGKLKALIIGEFPDRFEDEQGQHLIGTAGQLLREELKRNDLDLDRDFWTTNALICKTSANASPTEKQLQCCRENLLQTIRDLKPEFIIPLGTIALKALLFKRFSNFNIARFRKLCIPDQEYNAWILPIFHPSYILRNDRDVNLKSVYEKDIRYMVSCLDKAPPEFADFEKQVECITDYNEIVNKLESIIDDKPMIAFDYETSNIQPFYSIAKIWTVSYATEKETVSFPLDYPNLFDHAQLSQLKELWKLVLIDPKIKKIAHNYKFEDLWSRAIFGIDRVEGFHWDTMVAAHIINNRSAFCSLKFQSYINFGISGYENEVKPYISSKGEETNTLYKMPIDRLLLYNGLDSVLTYKLFNKQLKQTRKFTQPLNLFFDGIQALCDVQFQGIHTDVLYFKEMEKDLNLKIEEVLVRFREHEIHQQFQDKYGREIGIKKHISGMDLKKVCTELLGLKLDKRTLKGNTTLDEEVLKNANNSFLDIVLKYRKLTKIRSTYISPYIHNSFHDKIHPSFDLHMVLSYRSSSSNPNFL